MKHASTTCRRATAFTLVELLVVVAIIALLIAILLPSLDKARHSARAVAEQTQMRQITLGMRLYAGDNNGWLCQPSRKFSSITWMGNTRTNVWVLWNAQPVIGKYFGNKAMVCSAIWPPPELVSEIIYCPELTRAQKTFTRYKDMPWKNGLGMCNASAFSNTGIPLMRLTRPVAFGLLGCVGASSDDTPTSTWTYITRTVDGQALDTNYNDRTGSQHNAYRHLDNTNIAFADGHTASSSDAVADAKAGSLTFSK